MTENQKRHQAGSGEAGGQYAAHDRPDGASLAEGYAEQRALYVKAALATPLARHAELQNPELTADQLAEAVKSDSDAIRIGVGLHQNVAATTVYDLSHDASPIIADLALRHPLYEPRSLVEKSAHRARLLINGVPEVPAAFKKVA